MHRSILVVVSKVTSGYNLLRVGGGGQCSYTGEVLFEAGSELGDVGKPWGLFRL